MKNIFDGSWTNLLVVFALMWVAFELQPTLSVAVAVIVALQLILLGCNLCRVLEKASGEAWKGAAKEWEQAGAQVVGKILSGKGEQVRDIGFAGRQK